MFAAFLTDLLQPAAQTRNLQEVTPLFMRPRYVLSPLERGGAKHEAKAAAVVRGKLKQCSTKMAPGTRAQTVVHNPRVVIRGNQKNF